MNRFLTSSLLTLLLLVGGAQVVHAQFWDAYGNEFPTQEAASAADVANNAAGEAANVQAGYNPDGSLTDAQRAKINQASSQPVQKDTSQEAQFGGLMVWIVSLFAWLAGVAMVALNYATYYTVVDMGTYVKELSAVGVTWTVLRDLGNIMLIFGFLAVGITTIIGVEWYGGGKKMLPMMLVAAVFLNFSLFISEAVIDTGNLFATQFYTQINGGSLPTKDTLLNQGISSTVMNRLGLQTIYGDAQNPTKAAGVFKGSNSALIGFMSIILFIVLAFVLFTLAFVLVARFVVLIFLIILAPIGFAGLAVPMLKKRADQWWDKLFEQTVTAPILFLLLYIALRVITEMKNFGNSPDWTTYAGNVNPSAILGLGSAILTFLVTMGLLLLVVIQAKSLSAAGAAGATKLAGRATGLLSFGAISLAGRGTLGAAGYLLNNKRMQARASKGGVGGYAAKLASFTGRNLEGRTFDFRNIPGVRTAGTAAGGLVAGSGLENILAGGTTVTAKGAIDTTREAYKTYKPFSGEWWRAQQGEYEKAADELKRKSTLAGATPGSADVQKELKKMSVDELAQLKDIRGGIDSLVYNLSPEKFNELMKSDKLLSGEKAKLQKTWDTQFDAANVGTTMGRFSTEEVAALGGGTLLHEDPVTHGHHVIENLGITEFEAIRRKGTITRQQRHDIYAQINLAAHANPAYAVMVADYFDPANDPGGNREKYWNV